MCIGKRMLWLYSHRIKYLLHWSSLHDLLRVRPKAFTLCPKSSKWVIVFSNAVTKPFLFLRYMPSYIQMFYPQKGRSKYLHFLLQVGSCQLHHLLGWIHFVPGLAWFFQLGQNLASVISNVLQTLYLVALQTFHRCLLYQHLVHRIIFLFLPPSSFSGVTILTLLALILPFGPFMTLYGSLSGPRKVK